MVAFFLSVPFIPCQPSQSYRLANMVFPDSEVPAPGAASCIPHFFPFLFLAPDCDSSRND